MYSHFSVQSIVLKFDRKLLFSHDILLICVEYWTNEIYQNCLLQTMYFLPWLHYYKFISVNLLDHLKEHRKFIIVLFQTLRLVYGLISLSFTEAVSLVLAQLYISVILVSALVFWCQPRKTAKTNLYWNLIFFHFIFHSWHISRMLLRTSEPQDWHSFITLIITRK